MELQEYYSGRREKSGHYGTEGMFLARQRSFTTTEMKVCFWQNREVLPLRK